MTQKITSVADFRAVFQDGNIHEVVVVSGVLRSRRAVNRICAHEDPRKEMYEIWRLVDGAVEQQSLQELIIDDDAFLGKALRNQALYVDD